MRFMAGYQLFPDDRWVDALIAQRAHLYEIYFSFGDMPNARNALSTQTQWTPFEAQEKQCADLTKLQQAGIAFNLLLNANCYGAQSQSKALFNQVGDTVDMIRGRFGLQSITTTSPLLARFVKTNFPGLEVRASVNMSIGTVQGMASLKGYFDGFYMQREYNRDVQRITQLKAYCDGEGKRLLLLANSGCFNFCGAHHFHDNLVAHEKEIAGMDNAVAFKGVCWEALAEPAAQDAILRNTNFIRPEDLHLYEPWFSVAKLATRVNANPMHVLDCYVRGACSGDLLALMEPSHSGALYPRLLENSRIPADFGAKTLSCHSDCDACGYCERVCRDAMITLS